MRYIQLNGSVTRQTLESQTDPKSYILAFITQNRLPSPSFDLNLTTVERVRALSHILSISQSVSPVKQGLVFNARINRN